MKLKTIEFTSVEIETDLDLPVYFYFQDELGGEELIMTGEKSHVKVSRGHGGCTFEVLYRPMMVSPHHLKDLSTKEIFDEFFEEAQQDFKISMGGIL